MFVCVWFCFFIFAFVFCFVSGFVYLVQFVYFSLPPFSRYLIWDSLSIFSADTIPVDSFPALQNSCKEGIKGCQIRIMAFTLIFPLS